MGLSYLSLNTGLCAYSIHHQFSNVYYSILSSLSCRFIKSRGFVGGCVGHPLADELHPALKTHKP